MSENSNPYQASDAVIDAGPIVVAPLESEDAAYQIKFGVGATIGETFDALINSLGPLILISLIPFVPAVVMTIIAIGVIISIVFQKFPHMMENFSPEALFDLVGGLGVGVLIMTVVFVILAMVFTFPSFMGQIKILDEKSRYGEPRTGIWQTYMHGFRYVLPIFGFVILVYIAMVLLMLPVALFGSLPVVAVLYVVAILGVLSFVGIRFCVTLPVMVIEELPLFAALVRSNELVKGRTWKVMGIYGVFFAVMMGIGMGMGIVGMIPVIGQLAGLAMQVLMAPLQAALMFAIYAGLRSNSPAF
ncbi:MAG: glycerophosphoryl diester phosphodiesterase membrane domain-containing protein [Deltaproteobacteria bacterium]|nr:glycerophosphoryl diester phosphodiesterase membrane domain-containing protein [Deltaproteobacteria bacterium]MBN2670530.1 glycerophosphoryl diester phosphodiesterase membrane domain-containing protein [Deltaproteobacteria bacterium]